MSEEKKETQSTKTPESSFEIPSSDDSKVIFFGMSILFVIFGLFGGWMAIAPLSSASVSIGRVSADLNQKSIQHLEGGIVKTINVKNGDFVQKGQKLLQFKNANMMAQYNILQNQYLELVATQARLTALRDDKKSIQFPEELLEDRNDSLIAKIIEDQERTFKLKSKMNENDKFITSQRVTQLKEQLQGISSVITSKESRLTSLQSEIDEWQILYKERLVDKIKLRELEREKTMIEGDIASSYTDIARLNAQISEIKSQYLMRKKEIQEKLLNELSSIKLNLSEVRSKILASEDSIDRMIISAPISGTVVAMKLHTEGAVVKPGETIMEIVPTNSKLIVLTQIQTKDIDKVHNGLLADIRFSAFDSRSTHVIEGKVINVSADSQIDQVTNMPFYETKVEVTPQGQKDLEEYGFTLVAGMPAEVMIQIGDRTALDYFVKPFTDMFSRSFNEE